MRSLGHRLRLNFHRSGSLDAASLDHYLLLPRIRYLTSYHVGVDLNERKLTWGAFSLGFVG